MSPLSPQVTACNCLMMPSIQCAHCLFTSDISPSPPLSYLFNTLLNFTPTNSLHSTKHSLNALFVFTSTQYYSYSLSSYSCSLNSYSNSSILFFFFSFLYIILGLLYTIWLIHFKIFILYILIHKWSKQLAG